MKTRTVTVSEGEDCGPIDWTHPDAADRPALWRDAEQNPEGFLFCPAGMFTARRIFALRTYDGWPYWEPKPAILRESPMGGAEWTHFTSYGVCDDSIFRQEPPR